MKCEEMVRLVLSLTTPHKASWAVFLLIFLLGTLDGIRVYEGTNIPAPKTKPQKLFGMGKKSLYITKRSWNPIDDNEKPHLKSDKRGDGKWGDQIKKKSEHNDLPSLYKIKFEDANSLQFVKYIKALPRMEEYTFCLWYKTMDLFRDHTLFSYYLTNNERLLRFWINSADLTVRMAIRGHDAFAVPVNVRVNRWHHICQSWQGILGEWQVFLDGKRVGAGVLPQYKETYIPGGGEVVLGHDSSVDNQLGNDSIHGEIFGFNLVDEAVTSEQAVFINSQYKPNLRAPVPPFKKLPPIKKTYQEIKAYISRLPTSPSELGKGADSKYYPGAEKKPVKRVRDSTSSKRHRGNHRTRISPVRKIVVYNRNDRKLPLDEAYIEINKTMTTPETKMVESKKDEQVGKSNQQSYNENYSMHSYRLKKDDRKSSHYEIYEALNEEDSVATKSGNKTAEDISERKARQNFDLLTAREANKVYTLSNAVRDTRKQKFHFEKSFSEAMPGKSNDVHKSESSGDDPSVTKIARKPSDPIPVYESDFTLIRRKRSAVPEESLTDGFRRLPKIPETFIKIFSENATKTEMVQKLDKFFPNITEEVSTSSSFQTTSEPSTATFKLYPSITTQHPAAESPQKITETSVPFPQKVQQVTIIPSHDQHREANQSFLEHDAHRLPGTAINVRDFDPRSAAEDIQPAIWYKKAESAAERRKFDISAGTDLIMRAYGLCTSNRGSPIKDKQHLVISWAETPIRIFGGAEIESAKNECGNF